MARLPPDDARLFLYEAVKDKNSQISVQFGKSIVNTRFNEISNSSVVNVGAVVDALPKPPAKKGKKKKEDEKPGEESPSPDAKKAKKKVKKSDVPDLAPPRIAVADLSCEDQLSQTVSWRNISIIKNKLSAGIPSNTNFKLKTQTYDQLNPL